MCAFVRHNDDVDVGHNEIVCFSSLIRTHPDHISTGYMDARISLAINRSPGSLFSREYVLVGMAEYNYLRSNPSSFGTNQWVVLRLVVDGQIDFFISLNRQTGANRDTREAANQVVITQWENGPGTKSFLRGKLQQGDVFFIPNFAGSGDRVEIDVLEMDLSVQPATARIWICKRCDMIDPSPRSPSSLPSLAPSTTQQPSAPPSPLPTPIPSIDPTNNPSKRPTQRPSLRPSLTPSQPPPCPLDFVCQVGRRSASFWMYRWSGPQHVESRLDLSCTTECVMNWQVPSYQRRGYACGDCFTEPCPSQSSSADALNLQQNETTITGPPASMPNNTTSPSTAHAADNILRRKEVDCGRPWDVLAHEYVMIRRLLRSANATAGWLTDVITCETQCVPSALVRFYLRLGYSQGTCYDFEC